MNILRNEKLYNSILLVVPMIIVYFLGFLITFQIWYPDGAGEIFYIHFKIFSTMSSVWLALYYGFGLFDFITLRKPNQILKAVVGANAIGLIGAIIILYLQPTLIITPRRFLLVDTFFVFIFTLFWQLFIRSIFKRTIRHTICFIDLEKEYNSLKKELASTEQTKMLSKSSENLTELVAHYTPRLPFLFVVPNQPTFNPHTLTQFATLHAQGATFMKFDAFYEESFRRVYTTNLSDWWLLENTQKGSASLYGFIKRIGDMIFALMIFIAFLITFPAVYLLIKLSDRGPIFFKQTRLSVNGAPFTIYKYRTMRVGTANNTWTHDHDPRVTRVGTFLRATRLDELPQWLNILRGDMSFIGPRPEQAGIVEQIKNEIPYFESRHAIRPGLIGWAQLHVYAGNAEETKTKLQYDLYYLKHRSFLFDIEIFLKTIAHVFFLNGK